MGLPFCFIKYLWLSIETNFDKFYACFDWTIIALQMMLIHVYSVAHMLILFMDVWHCSVVLCVWALNSLQDLVFQIRTRNFTSLLTYRALFWVCIVLRDCFVCPTREPYECNPWTLIHRGLRSSSQQECFYWLWRF